MVLLAGHAGQGVWRGQYGWCMYWAILLWCQRRGGSLFRTRMSQAATVEGGVDLARSGVVFLGVGIFRVDLSFTVPLGWEGVSG